VGSLDVVQQILKPDFGTHDMICCSAVIVETTSQYTSRRGINFGVPPATFTMDW